MILENRLYASALIALLQRMLDFASVRYANNKNLFYYIELVKRAYQQAHVVEIDTLQADLKPEEIENTYKILTAQYKKWYLKVVRKTYDEELTPDRKIIFTFAEEEDIFNVLFEQSAKEVYNHVLKRATAGENDARIFLGRILFAGWGVPVNEQAGLQWLLKATENNDSEALYYTGMTYEKITKKMAGTSLNEFSLDYYYAAYNAGNQKAVYALYRYFQHYISGKTGQFRAQKWLKKGIELRETHCCYEMLEKPDTFWVSEDKDFLAKWLQEAVNLDIPEALDLMGCLYMEGHMGFPQNIQVAEKLFDRSHMIKK